MAGRHAYLAIRYTDLPSSSILLENAYVQTVDVLQIPSTLLLFFCSWHVIVVEIDVVQRVQGRMVAGSATSTSTGSRDDSPDDELLGGTRLNAACNKCA